MRCRSPRKLRLGFWTKARAWPEAKPSVGPIKKFDPLLRIGAGLQLKPLTLG